jgi:hypothetical protein
MTNDSFPKLWTELYHFPKAHKRVYQVVCQVHQQIAQTRTQDFVDSARLPGQ